MLKKLAIAGLCAAATIAAGVAQADEIRIAKQIQMNMLPLMIVEQEGLFEKHAKALGAEDLTAEWLTFAGGGAAVDALLSGNVDLVSTGLSNLCILWARTNGAVKGVAGVAGVPLELLTRNPKVKSISDFGEMDRIAVPTVRVSNQAITLAMELERLYGEGNGDRLDDQTVQMSQPDSVQALLNPRHEVNSFYASPPYNILAKRTEGVEPIFESATLFEVPPTTNVLFTSTSYYDDNEVAIKAMIAALDEANEMIASDKRKAAETYLEISRDKNLTVEDVVGVIENPGSVFSATPQGVMTFSTFMHRTGLINREPEKWEDVFFPAITGRQGS